MLFAPPPVGLDPGRWPGMELYAATILLEAEGEPDPGQLAVAWVIRNLLDLLDTDLAAVILGRDRVAYNDGFPYERFSCWGDDYAGQAKSRLTAPDPLRWEAVHRAAAGAYWRFVPDPTRGADHYLNVEATRRLRLTHDLPKWCDLSKTTVVIGRHTFLRLDARGAP